MLCPLTCPAVHVTLATIATYLVIDRKPLLKSRMKKAARETLFTLPSGLKLQLAGTLAALDRTMWEKVVPAKNFFLQWDFLLAFEQNAPSNMKFHYAIVSDGKKPLAAFYFQVIHLSAEELVYILQPLTSGVKLGIGAGLQDWIKKCRQENGFRLLVSGNNFISGEYGVGIAKNADPAKMFAALAETVKVITDTDRDPGKISAILAKDYFDDGARKAADTLRKKRYHRFVVEPEMIVALPKEWRTFDDYLAAMSKKYRNRAKAVLKKTEELEVVSLEGAALEKASEELFALYRNVHERAKFRLSLLGENYFVAMKKEFPDTFTVFGYRRNGQWVGFRSAFHLPGHLEAHFIGIDYCENEQCPLYQRILYDFIREGIDAGYEKVFLGRTAAEMKSTVGAVPHDLVCYIRHRNGLSNQVIRPFIDYLKPSPWVPRSPFKE